MANSCPNLIHLCRIRITRLDALGNPLPGPDNYWVSDSPAQLVVTPSIEAGKDIVQTGGCDCITGLYRGFDKLKRFDLDLDINKAEWGLLEMLTGATAIAGTDPLAPVGVWWSENAFDCSIPAQPNVAFEGWQDAYDIDHPDPDTPYVHWIYPSSFWQIAPHTMQNDFTAPKITGFTRGNTLWGTGPYGDLPEAAGPLGGGFETAIAPPAGLCHYQTVGVS